MPDTVTGLLASSALLGYLIGSVNFAVIVSRLYGVDILNAGSGNPGATNVKRVVGKAAGNIVFLLDALKGALGTLLPPFVASLILAQAADPAARDTAEASFRLHAAGFVGTLLGHCFSCFLRFRGGKGVASTIGGLLVILPVPILVGALVWALAFSATRYVSVASIALGLSLPISCWLLPQLTDRTYGPSEFWFAAALAAFNVWTHRSNIGRLLRGEESRFARKDPSA